MHYIAPIITLIVVLIISYLSYKESKVRIERNNVLLEKRYKIYNNIFVKMNELGESRTKTNFREFLHYCNCLQELNTILDLFTSRVINTDQFIKQSFVIFKKYNIDTKED